MSQSKIHSHYEITANSIAGIIIGWLLVFYIFPFIGVETTATQASLSSMMFFIASYSRAYVIRRIFNNKGLSMRTEEQDWEDLEKKIGAKTTDCRNQVTPQMREWFRDIFGYKADDRSVLTRWNERYQK